jgi:hypothetical protein
MPLEHRAQDDQVHDQSEAAHQRERDEADRHHAAHELVQQHDDVLPGHVGVELAFPGQAVAELVGQLAVTQRRRRGGEQVQQDLEADAETPALTQARAASWRIMKKPLIGSCRSALSTTRLSRVASG